MIGLTKNDSYWDGIERENKDDDEQSVFGRISVKSGSSQTGKRAPKPYKKHAEIDGAFTTRKSTVQILKNPEDQKEIIKRLLRPKNIVGQNALFDYCCHGNNWDINDAYVRLSQYIFNRCL